MQIFRPSGGATSELTAHEADTTSVHGIADTSALLTSAAAAAAYQPLDADLTAIAALSTTAYGRSLLEAIGAAALRTLAGLGSLAVLNDITASLVSDFDTQVRTSRLDQMAAPTTDVSINSHKLTNITDPASAQDAATKNYVDGVAQGLSVKGSARLATAVALPTNTYLAGVLTGVATGVLTVDGQAVALNDRILVKNEAAQANNGIYKCTTAGAIGVAYVLTRTTDMDVASEVPGAFAFVEEGTVNTGSGFVVADEGPYTVGTTAIVWTQFSGAGEIIAGTGITKNGNTLSVDTAVIAPLASPTFTGTPLAPTASIGTNTTQLATTAFVLANAGGGGSASTGLIAVAAMHAIGN